MIVEYIEELIERGHAYEVDGDVYFRVASYADYGKLSGQQPDQVEEQEPNERKEDPRDFALWKANKEGEDTSWNSPWGRGRPGWHIECSAMAEKLLGESFEIHGGGIDLLFPHHENELAQSRALGHEFARIWAHNGLVRFTGEKMSKSVGNVVTIREVLDKWGREALLLFFLTAHWRKPVDFSDETMAQAQARAETFRNAFTQLRSALGSGTTSRTRSRTTSTTPRRSPSCTTGATTTCSEALEIFGLKSLSERPSRRRSDIAARRAAWPRARRRTSPRPTACATRSRPPAGRCGTIRRLRARARGVTSDLVYGRRPFARRCAAVARCWSSGRPIARSRPSRGCARTRVARPGQAGARADGARRHARPPGRGRARRAVSLRRRLRARRGRASAARLLDRVTDPRNLGAVCRSAEGAGATGVVVPAHGSAVVTPAVCRARRPARSSTCRSRS